MVEDKKFSKRGYLDALNERVLVFDGAMGTNLQAMNLTADAFGGEQKFGCYDCLVLSYPQAVEKVHQKFLEAGADVIETDTFRANRLTLKDYGIAEKTQEINLKAARLARKLADQYSTTDKPRFVAGSLGPSGMLISTDDPQMSAITYEELADVFREQAVGLIRGMVDLLLIETSQDILEVKAAITGIQQAYEETGEKIPIQAQVTLEPFSDQLVEFVEKYGVNVVGGCCGTNPEHIRLLAEKIGQRKAGRSHVKTIPKLASPVQAVPMQQEPAPFLIGERLNAQGSRKFKRVLMAEDYDAMLEIAKEQVASGAHGLDVCVAITERSDEIHLMQRLVKRLSLEVPVPLVIDTTELDVLEAALKTCPGRCLINSTNLESGEEKARKVFALAKKYNAAVILLTIDEKGMAKTAERKLEVAQRLYKLAVEESGLKPQDLVFDALTFTLATGDVEYEASAVETLKGIRMIKEGLPGVLTSLGVSNVSFGLSKAARKVINSIFLYHAVKAGLDMAIVNAAQIKPYAEIAEGERQMVEDLIFNRRKDSLGNIIKHFKSVSDEGGEEKATDEAFNNLSAGQRLRLRILHRQKAGVEKDIDELLDSDDKNSKSERAVGILNQVLLPAMKEVGDKFAAGELILPFVLQSAEVMKKAVAYLEQFLDREEGVSKGKLVLATVYGDVHDIGKNLVKTILSNNGYDVIDLGKQVPAETIISRAVEEKADAIGLSALLVSTSKQMPLIINELARRGHQTPVLIGGAAINSRFGWHILKTEEGSYYDPGVFYCKDAFEGLAVMDALSDPIKRNELIKENQARADFEFGHSQGLKLRKTADQSGKSVPAAEFIPQPPYWGIRVVDSMPLELVADHLSRKELFRLSWGARNTHAEEWETIKAEFEARLKWMLQDAQRDGWLRPQAVYGYWPVQSDGNDLILFDPDLIRDGSLKEVERFSFPRQSGADNLSLADYFLPVGNEQVDVVALQVVTVGAEATKRFGELESTGDYSEAYYSHGLAVQMAAYLHDHIRQELNLSEGQGLRYSWGYSAIPELADHQKVFKLLPAESALGMHLTSAYQLVPEQSTAAIIVHHPSAKYFNIGVNHLEQLLS